MRFKCCSIAVPKGGNQDAILEPFQVGDATWCGIADGVGSAALGGLAARTSLEEIKRVMDPRGNMEEVFARVARKLSELGSNQDNPKSISTTLSVLCIDEYNARLGHVGDTRITHYRGRGIMTRSKEQTEVQKLLDEGVISKFQARRYPRRNVLLSAMSAGREYDLSEAAFSVKKGDRILLTSDGFHNKLLRGEIAAISIKNPDFLSFWQAIEEALSKLTLEDDASCLALEIE